MASEGQKHVLSGAIIDESVEITVDQVMYYCAAGRETITAMVTEGVLQPRGGTDGEWRFPGHALRRAAKALRLQRDLDINLNAAALVLDLLDEIEDLRARVDDRRNATD